MGVIAASRGPITKGDLPRKLTWVRGQTLEKEISITGISEAAVSGDK